MSDYFLADDLSGALDAAAAFHHARRHVRIVLRPDAWSAGAPGEVIAITTETRNEPPARAQEIVRAVLARGQALGARLRYKKIDSTLRGPIAAELEAVMAALPETRVLFAPANPAVGRTVRDGVLLVNGVPVADTPFGQDPGSPLRTSEVREILGRAATDRVSIPDTTTVADLGAAVAAMQAVTDRWIGIGSGALAVVIARDVKSARRADEHAELPVVAPSPRLMIGGSAHPLNRSQIQALSAAHGLVSHELSFATPRESGATAAATLRASGGAVLHMPMDRTTRTAALDALVEAGEIAIREGGARRIFMTGGETAYALCTRLGIATLVFVAEIEPGLSLSIGSSVVGPLLLAVKPGGFGDEHTWKRAWDALGGN